MGRLILIPQYPAKLRYQEWWYEEFPQRMSAYYDVVISLCGNLDTPIQADSDKFSPLRKSVNFELFQIEQLLELELKSDDTLLLCDLSYPGLFTGVLMHKRPNKCFAICHGTSKNNYDYFQPVRNWKWPIESAHAKVYDGVFVASHYHRTKLGWKNIYVEKFPDPPFEGQDATHKFNGIVSASRRTIQKRTLQWEKELSDDLHIPITYETWKRG